MRNTILGVIIMIVIALGVVYSFNYNNETPISDAVIQERDEFGNKYNIDNQYFLISTPLEVATLIESDQTIVVFVGRETWPFCRRTVPELHSAVGNSNFDTVYYIQSDDSANNGFINQYDIYADPTILFFKAGELDGSIVGFADQEEFEIILSSLQ